MLTIRPEQMQALSLAAERTFIARMVAHLTEHFPAHALALGPERLANDIAEGIAQARVHGIVAERDVCDFLALRCELGPDFDTDPDLPWAEQILADESIADPHDRIEALYRRALAPGSAAGEGR